jgi:hypothetical protein
MTSIKWATDSDVSVITTGLNSLANDAYAETSAISNSSDLYLFDDVELYIASFGATPSTGARVELYMICKRLDDSSFEDGSTSVTPSPSTLVGVFDIREDSGTQIHILRHIPLPPSDFKYIVRNKTGQSFASSSNLLRRKPYYYQTV